MFKRIDRALGSLPLPWKTWSAVAGLGSVFSLAGCAPHSPVDDAMAGFTLHPDFVMELAAAEPLVRDPVDLEFDARGRAFVLEMPGFPTMPDEPQGLEDNEFPGKIVLLQDTDGDGRFDQRRVFARNFRYADSILPYEGGLLVADPPDLVFVRDSDDDGEADERRVLLSGFRVGFSESNFNGLRHGLDNWIYGANGSSGGEVFFPHETEHKVSIRGQDFRFDLRRRKFETVGPMGGGFGLDFDDRGRLFVTHEQRHIQHRVFPHRYLGRLKALVEPTVTEISDHGRGATAALFPVGVPESRVNHPEQSGFFSAGCGLTYYGGGAFPEGVEGDFFVADAVLNLVHRDRLRAHGPSFVASRGRPETEFLASTDRSFRPVNMTVGPDGALYLLDMHRRVIEHPEWIPDELEEAMDLRAGEDQGRIYRILPKEPRRPAKPEVTPRFHRGDLPGAVAALGHRNKWWRDTAQRLLVEWRDPASVALLGGLATSGGPRARLHALWTLEALDALGLEPLRAALEDDDPGVRENALVLAERRLEASPPLLDAVLKRSRDPDPRVRMLALFTLANGGPPADGQDRIEKATLALAETADLANRWSRLAVVAALAQRPLSGFLGLLALYEARYPAAEDGWRSGGAQGLATLAAVLGEDAGGEELAQVVLRLAQGRGQGPLNDVFGGLARGLERRAQGTGPAPVLSPAARTEVQRALTPLLTLSPSPDLVGAWRLARVLDLPATSPPWGPTQKIRIQEAAATVRDQDAKLDERRISLDLVELGEWPGRKELLYDLLSVRHPAGLRVAALEQLARMEEPHMARRLISMWDTLGPETRNRARDLLLFRRRHHDALLSALESGEIGIGQLNLHLERRRALLRSPDPEIRRRAQALFSDAGVRTRVEALERMRPALALAGDPQRGRRHFTDLCSRCHRLAGLEATPGAGQGLGPDLSHLSSKSAEHLLHDIVDPNAAVATEYLSYTVVTTQGEVLTGLLASETETGVVLRLAESGDRILSRGQVQELTASGLSLMPEELESGLDLQGMADLLAFLQVRR